MFFIGEQRLAALGRQVLANEFNSLVRDWIQEFFFSPKALKSESDEAPANCLCNSHVSLPCSSRRPLRLDLCGLASWLNFSIRVFGLCAKRKLKGRRAIKSGSQGFKIQN
jgi:hypothetical protein